MTVTKKHLLEFMQEDYDRVNIFFTFLDKVLAGIENCFSGNDQDVLCALGDVTLDR